MNTQTEPNQKSPENITYAGFGTRYAALVLDWELFLFIIILCTITFPSFVRQYQDIIGLISILLFLTYKIVSLKIYRKTIGKNIFGLRVNSLKSEKISLLQSAVRELTGFFISAPFLIGEFLYFFTSKKQALQDKFASTAVIQEKPLTLFIKILAITVIFIVPIVYVFFIILVTASHNDNIKKSDLIESISQKSQILIGAKELCQSLPSFQTQQIICVMNNDSKCSLDQMSITQLEDLNSQEEDSHHRLHKSSKRIGK